MDNITFDALLTQGNILFKENQFQKAILKYEEAMIKFPATETS